jgi:hypothetical protein
MTDSTDNARGPERICTWPSCGCTARGQCQGLGLRHVRADLAPDPLDDPRVKALVEAAQAVHDDLLRRGLDVNDPETETPYRQVSIGCSAWAGLCAALAAFDKGGKNE